MAAEGCPLVSVVMPAYNGEKFIEAAVRSVMAQSVSDWELLILDDGSRDGTWRIAQALAREDERIRLYRNDGNLGPAKTRNRGLDLCRGKYVALLDCDDLWYPRKLEAQLALMEGTKADVVYCSYAIIDHGGQKCCSDFIVPETTDLEATLVRNVISCSTAMLSRDVAKGYRFPETDHHEDLALWLRLLGDGKRAVGTPRVLAAYRIRPGVRACQKLRVARPLWELYRSGLGLTVGESACCFLRYAVAGFRKYQRWSQWTGH